MIFYDAAGFGLRIDETNKAAVFEFRTVDGQKAAIRISGEAFARICRRIAPVLEQRPDIGHWKPAARN